MKPNEKTAIVTGASSGIGRAIAASFAAEGAPAEAAAETVGRYNALTTGMIGVLAVCLVAGVLLAWRVKSPAIGDYLKLSVDARGARTRADEILRSRGLDPNSYHHATLLANTTDAVSNEFLRERVGVAEVNEIYKVRTPGALWSVRYFRDGQPEEYVVVLKPDGTLHSVHHTLSEDAPGASLSKEQAEARGEEFLRKEKQIDLAQWSLVESKSDKHPHRVDHTLTWEENRALDSGDQQKSYGKGSAHARIELQLLGDEVANLSLATLTSSSTARLELLDRWSAMSQRCSRFSRLAS